MAQLIHLGFPSRVIEPSVHFINYLQEDGIIIPQVEDYDAYGTTLVEIQHTIEEFGAVFCKLQTSAPTDAVWILAEKTLKCRSVEDVLLLLKSSDRIAGDVQADHPLLILKEWRTLHPSMEFRCFVKGRVVVGMCQRDGGYYAYLSGMAQRIEDRVTRWHTRHVRDVLEVEDVVLDVYYDHGRVWLVDVDNFGDVDPLLFTWQELQHTDTSLGLRLIQSEMESRKSSDHLNKFPLEAVAIAYNQRDWETLLHNQEAEEEEG